MKKTIQNKIHSLRNKIRHYDHLYYNLDRPEITDYEYDQLFKQLIDLENKYPEFKTKDSPSLKVPGLALEKFEKSAHSLPMLSLQNSYSKKGIRNFYERVSKLLNKKNLTCFLEPKLDGMAVELIYENGFLTKALSRGDGLMGEDITENVKTLRGLPLALTKKAPPLLEVRGEVLIFKKDFKRINKEQEEASLNTFSNPRNLTAGSLRQLDPKITASRPLYCFIHSPGQIKGLDLKSQKEFINKMRSLSLPCFRLADEKIKNPLDLCGLSRSLKDIFKYYEEMQKLRPFLPFEIDGIVIKVNHFEEQKTLGSIARNPRWALAGKFSPERGTTQVIDIKLQVGRTGVVTPVAVLKPVFIGGVQIQKASLHNFQDLKKKDIRKGDFVLIHRAGDVIPEVIKPLIKKRRKDSEAFAPPSICPVCQSQLIRKGDYLVCQNLKCSAVAENKLQHFVSKKAMDIEFLGKKSLRKFYKWGWLNNYSDIYALKDKPLENKEGFGEKSHRLLIQNLEKSKKSSLPRLIFALGIPLVGEQTAQKISATIYEKYKGQDLDIEKALPLLQSLTIEDLESIADIGPLVAHSFEAAFRDPELIIDLKNLHKQGVRLIKKDKQGKAFEGMSFVITGTLPESRTAVIKRIEGQGGRVTSQVSQKTSFLLAGEKPGSKKQKARQLGIKALNWVDFLRLIGGGV